jgi:hypothetical protein
MPATIGSIFCAQFGKHISLGDPAISVNSPGMFNFQVDITFANHMNQAFVKTVAYAIFAYDQVMEISEGGDCQFMIPDISYQHQKYGTGGALVKVPYEQNGGGGVNGDGISDMLRNAHKWLKDTKAISSVAKAITPLLPPGVQTIAGPLAEMADQYGYGTGNGIMSQNELRDHIRKLGRTRGSRM